MHHRLVMSPACRPGKCCPDGVEKLTYDNPYGMEIERVRFDGKIVY